MKRGGDLMSNKVIKRVMILLVAVSVALFSASFADVSPHGEDFITITNVAKAIDEIYQNNENASELFAIYSNDSFEEYFNSDINTGEVEWKSLDNPTKFMYYILIYYPNVCINNQSLSSDEKVFLNNLAFTKRYFSNLENQSLSDALTDAWKYHYKQWGQNGVFVTYNIEDMISVIENNSISFTVEKVDTTKIKNIYKEDPSFLDLLVHLFKKNIISIVLAFITTSVIVVKIVAERIKMKNEEEGEQ